MPHNDDSFYYDDLAQSNSSEYGYSCVECDSLCDVEGLCYNCQDNNPYDDYDPSMDMPDFVESSFANPGGASALRASTPDNPRILPCPTCETPNCLTPADRLRGYQCDDCAFKTERGGY